MCYAFMNKLLDSFCHNGCQVCYKRRRSKVRDLDGAFSFDHSGLKQILWFLGWQIAVLLLRYFQNEPFKMHDEIIDFLFHSYDSITKTVVLNLRSNLGLSVCYMNSIISMRNEMKKCDCHCHDVEIKKKVFVIFIWLYTNTICFGLFS